MSETIKIKTNRAIRRSKTETVPANTNCEIETTTGELWVRLGWATPFKTESIKVVTASASTGTDNNKPIDSGFDLSELKKEDLQGYLNEFGVTFPGNTGEAKLREKLHQAILDNKEKAEELLGSDK